ncbi:MAG: helicase-related protein [Nanoarchaeota archaeon]
MEEIIQVENKYNDQTINLALQTLGLDKQVLIFNNTKKSAEKTAEDISKKVKNLNNQNNLQRLAEKILKSLSRPTKQCERLSRCVKKGTAFHHAGLTQEQKDLIHESFSKGIIKVISATPTLAAGVDLPAYRAIIKDARRYTSSGLQFIPVLEYLQMAGRAGRPSFDSTGEAILISKTEAEKEKLIEKYLHGKPENIYSKLAAEPALRFYLLSLIAGNFVRSKEQIMNFFSKTYWAYQYEDMAQLQGIIERMLKLLIEYGFINSTETDDFVGADEMNSAKFEATKLGKRVSELYLDPATAYDLINAMKRADVQRVNEFSYIHMFSFTNELKPLLRVKMKEFDDYQEMAATHEDDMIRPIPTPFDYEYDGFMNSIKTASFFLNWLNERNEEYLLEKYDIRPGEIRAKIDIADWLVYSSIEMAKLLELKDVYRQLNIIRERLKYGAKEELLALLRLKNIGRVRARKLFKNSIHNIKDIKSADLTTLKQILGEKTAIDVKKQVGQEYKEVPRGRRKGQLSIEKY